MAFSFSLYNNRLRYYSFSVAALKNHKSSGLEQNFCGLEVSTVSQAKSKVLGGSVPFWRL